MQLRVLVDQSVLVRSFIWYWTNFTFFSSFFLSFPSLNELISLRLHRTRDKLVTFFLMTDFLGLLWKKLRYIDEDHGHVETWSNFMTDMYKMCTLHIRTGRARLPTGNLMIYTMGIWGYLVYVFFSSFLFRGQWLIGGLKDKQLYPFASVDRLIFCFLNIQSKNKITQYGTLLFTN